jgi:signal peptidase I
MTQKVNKDVKVSLSENSQNTVYQGVGSFILEIIKIVFLAFIIIIPIRIFLFQPFFVQGASMEPNFENNQYLIVNELGYKKTTLGVGSYNWLQINPFRKIERQKVIVFRYPLNPQKFFIKRVIGLPGEKVKIENGKVTIFNKEHPNGFFLDEKAYLPMGVKTLGDMTITLKNNQYFVMGDNRMFSSDSRSWGPVPASDVIGRVELRAWPLNKIKLY